MHILILTNRIPYPLKDGGSLAMHYFIEGYIEAGIKVSLLAMNTARHYTDTTRLPAIYGKLEHFRTVDVDNRVTAWGVLANLFRPGKSYNIQRFDNAHYRVALKELLTSQHFDFVQLESLYLTPYVPTIREHSKAKIILRSHNIEYKIWERLYLQEQKPLKKAYLRLLTRRLKQYELEHLEDYDIILPISDVDRDFYLIQNVKAPLYTQTFGIKISNQPAVQDITPPDIKLYHIGAMDWQPNLDSVKWLMDEIMPEVYKTHPRVRLYLAGRNMPASLMHHTAPNVVVVGEVEDAYEFEKDKHILLVPIMSGSGVRIKIFQGMAIGKAVITTPIGVEGIDVSHKEHLLVADNREEFIKYIRLLLDNPEEIRRLGCNGARTIREHYNRDLQINELLQFLQQHLN